jgi:hypothetical protein
MGILMVLLESYQISVEKEIRDTNNKVYVLSAEIFGCVRFICGVFWIYDITKSLLSPTPNLIYFNPNIFNF